MSGINFKIRDKHEIKKTIHFQEIKQSPKPDSEM